MKKSIVIKLSLILCIALTIFALVSCSIMVHNDNKLIGDNLISLANGYAGALIVSDPESVVKYDTNAHVRVTIIAADGTVLADSYGKVNEMDNHLDREEVQNADKAGNTKIVKRFSKTGNSTLMYFAKKVQVGDTYNYLRVSMEAADVTMYLTSTIVTVVLMTIIMILLSSAVANAFIKSSLRPLKDLAGSLESIKAGSYTPMMSHDKSHELNSLTAKINDINEVIAAGIRENSIERDKLNNLLERMSQAVIAGNVKGEVIFCNSRAIELLGCKDLIGKGINQVVLESAVKDALRGLEAGGVETVFFDRAKKNYRANITDIKKHDGELKTIILISDVTKLRLAERERREFFANASHELKTPLTAIKGYAELIGTGIAKGDKAVSYGDKISGEAKKLLDIINDMLVLSKLDERIDTEEKVRVDLVSEVTATLSKFDERIGQRGISVSVVGNGDAVISLQNIHSIVSNILSNAIKYNVDQGSIAVTINSHAKGTTLTVTDSGIGISAKDLPRVTERFYKADTARTMTDSTGLGLAIVKHICEVNHVKIAITSEVGKGTTVALTFPKIKQIVAESSQDEA